MEGGGLALLAWRSMRPPSCSARPPRRAASPAGVLALALCGAGLVAGGCRVPELEGEPFAYLQPGRAGLVVKQPLANQHDLEGEFDGGPIPDPGGGPPSFFTVEDDGGVLGKYELSLGIRDVIAENTTVEFAFGYRQFDIEGLNPSPDPDILLAIETVDSLQLALALRRYFPGPGFLSERWRWFLELGLFYVPGIAVDSELRFLSTTQAISSDGDPYEFLGLTGGVAYALSDTLLLEGGFTWEEPLRPLEFDLTTTVNFGSTPITIPMEASMRPVGGLVFVSLTWFPLSRSEALALPSSEAP